MSAGVPQGSILGPLLISLYVNDLPNVCPNANTQMYADDTVIFVHANSAAQAADLLSNSMQKVTEWLIHNCLQLNVSKTVCMFFSKSKSRCAAPYVVVAGGDKKLSQILNTLEYTLITILLLNYILRRFVITSSTT